MKKLFLAGLLLMSSFAFADYQLLCRQNISPSQQKIDVFVLRGAIKSFQQTQQVIHVKDIFQIPTNPYTSVSNQDVPQDTRFERDEYLVQRVQSTLNGDSFTIDLNGGGSLNFKFNFSSNFWDGHFIKPNGPELPQVFSECTLENFEIGFTAHN